jgi:hypothetical protein
LTGGLDYNFISTYPSVFTTGTVTKILTITFYEVGLLAVAVFYGSRTREMNAGEAFMKMSRSVKISTCLNRLKNDDIKEVLQETK